MESFRSNWWSSWAGWAPTCDRTGGRSYRQETPRFRPPPLLSVWSVSTGRPGCVRFTNCFLRLGALRCIRPRQLRRRRLQFTAEPRRTSRANADPANRREHTWLFCCSQPGCRRLSFDKPTIKTKTKSLQITPSRSEIEPSSPARVRASVRPQFEGIERKLKAFHTGRQTVRACSSVSPYKTPSQHWVFVLGI